MTSTLQQRRSVDAFTVLVTLLLWLLVNGIRPVNGEFYSAIAGMEELLDTETVLIANMEAYIYSNERRLDFLKRRVEIYKREHQKASSNIADYLSNPINAFLLTKRLSSDWRSIEIMMTCDVSTENNTDYRNRLQFPTDADLNGAAVALTRLQDTYQLETASIARGQLNGVQYSSEMSANDCFQIGRQTYLNKDYNHAALWLREAINRLTAENAVCEPEQVLTLRAEILDILAFSEYMLDNVVTALQLTNELLELQPDHERALDNKQYYEIKIAKRSTDERIRTVDGSSVLISSHGVSQAEKQQYERLCRNDVNRSASVLAPMRCRRVTNGIAFRRLAPLNLEEANLDPYIVIYHDVISNEEIEVVKQMAKPSLQRAMVIDRNNSKSVVSNYRVSKLAWLNDDDHAHVARISRRVEDMTGLTTSTAEQLQVLNYGIGGHYEPHLDFGIPGENKRIATVLFYMSDVEQGGATVFPRLNVALQPRKGTAAFWMNLYASGRGDYRSLHAGCPVLIGSKWVCNKWLHEAEQDVRRPCGLEPDHPLNE